VDTEGRLPGDAWATRTTGALQTDNLRSHERLCSVQPAASGGKKPLTPSQGFDRTPSKALGDQVWRSTLGLSYHGLAPRHLSRQDVYYHVSVQYRLAVIGDPPISSNIHGRL